MKRRRFAALLAGLALGVVVATGSVSADSYNPAEHLFNHWGPLQPSPPLTETPIPEPGKSNTYVWEQYQNFHWYGAPLPH